jgi:glycosyltransferase involved in cell wall biosynthesis
MTDDLRVLMVAHTPWDLRLGAPSVQMHIAEHLRALGHHVDFLGSAEVVPRPPQTRIGQLLVPSFGRRAVPAVRARAQEYDVIDAHQGNLPVQRSDLGFDGVLVTRSAGLTHAYRRFLDSIPQRWESAPPTNRWAAPVRRRKARTEMRHAEASFRASDLILVPNAAEAEELAAMGFGAVTRVVANGIPDELLHRAAADRGADAGRASERRVSVIATWDLRKGRLDWPRILAAVRSRVPEATFTFLGTGVAEERVLADLGHPEGVHVVPTYDPTTLPDLLAGTKAGALASYVEGFGLGLVEQMACGVPSVAYDVPGPRHTIGALDRDFLVPVGDVTAFADQLVRLLTMDTHTFAGLARRARDAATHYRYSAIAAETLQAYRSACTRNR